MHQRDEGLWAQQVAAQKLVDLAAERTFLMWIRTSGSLLILGFALDQFAVFLATMEQRGESFLLNRPGPFVPAWLGTVFVALGALILGVSALRYSRFYMTHKIHTLPARNGV